MCRCAAARTPARDECQKKAAAAGQEKLRAVVFIWLSHVSPSARVTYRVTYRRLLESRIAVCSCPGIIATGHCPHLLRFRQSRSHPARRRRLPPPPPPPPPPSKIGTQLQAREARFSSRPSVQDAGLQARCPSTPDPRSRPVRPWPEPVLPLLRPGPSTLCLGPARAPSA